MSFLSGRHAPETRARKELEEWLETFYVGGAVAAREDSVLRNQTPKLKTHRHKAMERRAYIVARVKNVEDMIERGSTEESAREYGIRVAELHAVADRMEGRRANETSEEELVRSVRDRYHSASAHWLAQRRRETKQVQDELERGGAGKQRRELSQRLDVLTRATDEGKAADNREKMDWIEQRYPGKTMQTVADKKLVDAIVARERRKANVILGKDTTTPLEEIDWSSARFPQRKDDAVEVSSAAAPTISERAKIKFPTLVPPGRDQEIGM